MFKKIEHKLEEFFKNSFSSYSRFALLLLILTIALTIPLTYSLLSRANSNEQVLSVTVENVSTEFFIGDIDQDKRVDLLDYNMLISCYNGKPCASSQRADLNLDGLVEEKDLNILLTSFETRQGD